MVTPFRDASALVAVGDERGLLGLAFHPRYRDKGRLIVDSTRAADGANPLCRFCLGPAYGDSHFPSASPAECAATAAAFPLLILEPSAAMYLALRDPATDASATGQAPIHRRWNARADSDHRYTTDRAIRDRMTAQGYVAEGYRPAAVAMCAASPRSRHDFAARARTV